MKVSEGTRAGAVGAHHDTLLEAQRRVLEMLLHGRALSEILTQLCLILEQHAQSPARAQIVLLDEQGRQADPAAAHDFSDADTWSMQIMSVHGKALGSFRAQFGEGRAPSPHERLLVEVLATAAGLAIDRHRSEQEQREALTRSQFLSELALATQRLSEAADVMAVTSKMLAEHLGVERCAYAAVEDEQVFVITGDYTVNVPSIVGRWPVAAFGPRCTSDMLAGKPYVVEDVDTDPDISPEHLPAYHATTIRAVVCVPLHKHDKFTAAMAVHQTRPRRWTAGEVELVTRVVARCWEALERARVTQTLRESEARYRAMVEASPECVMLVARDGTLRQINPAGLRILEVSSEDSVLGASVDDFIAPEHRQRFRAFNEQVCQGAGGTLQFEVIGRGGARRAMESTAVPLDRSTGERDQLAVARDVTARVAAERALTESRARLDYAVRLSGVGFWYCDLPFDELAWDERVKEHFFLRPDARVTIDMFYALIHPDDRELTRQAIDASIREHTSYDVIYRTVDPEAGGIKWVRALGGTAYAEDGSPARFDGVTVDVTAQRLDQERLARALERERAQARRLKKVADAALTIHATSSVDSVLHVVGRAAQDILEAATFVTSLTGPDESTLVDSRPEPVRSAAAGSLTVPLVGRKGVLLGSVQLSHKPNGEFTESDEAILMQLAQVGSVALQNARLYDRLREQDRRKDEFLATLAHELRNPLAPIRTGLQVLQLQQDPTQARKTYKMMERQLRHLVRMVDDLLDVSRITLGKVTLQTEIVDIRSAVHNALETTRALVDAAKHELRVELPSRPVELKGDPTRLVQIISNLVNNAAKYTPAGGRILVRVESEAGWLHLRVEDNGVGIPRDMLTKVFDMFTQVTPSFAPSQGGLGIGLTLVRRLVEMHGGSIEAESAGQGQGTTLHVRLPLLSQAAAADHRGPEQAPRPASAKLKILVVDDNIDGAEALAMLLELLGHHTDLAHDGPAALAQVSSCRPDLVFLDIGLPGLTGYEVAQRVRADASLKQPTLVALTGWGTEEDRRQAMAAGFDHHMVKPADPAKVRALLDSVVDAMR